MKSASPRRMTFDVRAIGTDVVGDRWHWTVYEDPHGCFVRNGQVSGDRDKAERAARAAIAIMGGKAVCDEQDERGSPPAPAPP